MHREKSMVDKRINNASVEAIEKRPYALLIIDAQGIDEVRKWFHSNAPKYSFEKVFVAEMKAVAPLKKSIGFVALIKFGSMKQMKATLLSINREIKRHEDWKCDFMKAEWIELKGLERAAQDMARRVTPEGRIQFQNHRYFVTTHLRGEEVDLKVNNGMLEIYYQGTLVKTLTLRNDVSKAKEATSNVEGRRESEA